MTSRPWQSREASIMEIKCVPCTSNPVPLGKTALGGSCSISWSSVSLRMQHSATGSMAEQFLRLMTSTPSIQRSSNDARVGHGSNRARTTHGTALERGSVRAGSTKRPIWSKHAAAVAFPSTHGR
eukprot:CAMPEP_0204495940 /NCGR_PEP_ID=MMETSP0471-20130131/87586_1 /ASSEMBLY_ACC=CAM_ASM_000602 /TAXON_ID=2969 /ORGANISM="Oxyrrhis marina" /LENGTH=124 /DNA_ID=CAMNT_0051500247 /DNA_START=152 /DNA_END=522 /DNA_ORIENTATION=+